MLRSAPLGPYTHLLAREGTAPATDAEHEEATDRLAFEWVAPAALGDSPTLTRLVHDYSLPRGPAARYAEFLAPPTDPEDRAWARLLRGVR